MLNVMMNQLSGTVYATKRRRRNGKSIKPPPKDGMAKSNPSKRHRERLNAELDNLASLLPFEQNILSKLDRLSILRLAVSYLRTKSYFQVSMVREKEEVGGGEYGRGGNSRGGELIAYDHTPLDGEFFLQALNGFLLILTCEGEVFFATHSIESYLGFHQSDIVHQSVYELVHSEDREELQRQLLWNAFCPAELSGASLQELIHEQAHFLERSFTVRFRCLLDNTSGFLRLDIRGRIKVLHGQNRKTEDPPLALFALCTPFGPPSLLELPNKEVMFKSKHKLDLSLVSMDQRGKMLFAYSDSELTTMGGYDLVHFDDLAYVASAHQELLKTGASGLIAYRLQTKEGQWQWLQTSSRLVYKNSKPDFIISTHRPLMNEEGRDLLGKRTMDFKVSYLDAGLTNSYFSDQDSNTLLGGGGGLMEATRSLSSGASSSVPTSKPRRTKRSNKTTNSNSSHTTPSHHHTHLSSLYGPPTTPTTPLTSLHHPHPALIPLTPSDFSHHHHSHHHPLLPDASSSSSSGGNHHHHHQTNPLLQYPPPGGGAGGVTTPSAYNPGSYHFDSYSSPTHHQHHHHHQQQSFYAANQFENYATSPLFQYRHYYPQECPATAWSCLYEDYASKQPFSLEKMVKAEIKSEYSSSGGGGGGGSSNGISPEGRPSVLMWTGGNNNNIVNNNNNNNNSNSSSSSSNKQLFEKKYSSLLDPLKSMVIPPGDEEGGVIGVGVGGKYLQAYSSDEVNSWHSSISSSNLHHGTSASMNANHAMPIPHLIGSAGNNHSLGSAIDSYPTHHPPHHPAHLTSSSVNSSSHSLHHHHHHSSVITPSAAAASRTTTELLCQSLR